ADDDVQMWDLRVLRRPFPRGERHDESGDRQPDVVAGASRAAVHGHVAAAGCSNPKVGYRCVTHYSEGIRLGTAIAISGAAVGSSIGERASPALAFLLTRWSSAGATASS